MATGNIYKVTVEEVVDRGAFWLKQGTNEVQEPTSDSRHRATFICEPASAAKFDTLLSTINTAITTAET